MDINKIKLTTMKPKNKIKFLEKAIELASLILKLQLSKTDYKGTPPIPEYKKGAKEDGLKIVSDGKYSEHIFDNSNAKKEARSHFTDALKMALEKGNIKFPEKSISDNLVNELKSFQLDIPDHSKDWSELNEYLKSKNLNNTEPFGFAPIEPKDFVFKRNGIPIDVEVDKKGIFTFKDKTPIAPPLGFSHNFHKQAVEDEKELDRVCKPKKECEHYRRKIDNWYEHYSSINSPSITTIVCLDCGENLTLNKRQEMKNRQIEIGKEIEKLRIEARTIKNQLKDSK